MGQLICYMHYHYRRYPPCAQSHPFVLLCTKIPPKCPYVNAVFITIQDKRTSDFLSYSSLSVSRQPLDVKARKFSQNRPIWDFYAEERRYHAKWTIKTRLHSSARSGFGIHYMAPSVLYLQKPQIFISGIYRDLIYRSFCGHPPAPLIHLTIQK